MINVFNQFQALVGSTVTDLVDITANNGNGTSNATTLSGVSIVVRGESVASGSRALIQNGNVVAQGPSGNVVEVLV